MLHTTLKCPPARLVLDARLRAGFVADNIPNTVIQPSPIHGMGLFATALIHKNETLCQLDGQLVDWDSYDAATALQPFGQLSDDLFMEWNALAPDLLLIRPFRTKYSYINHSRTPNLTRQSSPVAIVAMVDIQPGTELTLDYRAEPLKLGYLVTAQYL